MKPLTIEQLKSLEVGDYRGVEECRKKKGIKTRD